MRSLRIVLLLGLWSAVLGAQSQTIVIDAAAPAHPFPHFWERMFGSGRANLTLRDSYRDDLRSVKQATGFEYVRFHAIFQDENGVYGEDARGNPIYNWSYVDQIYDGLLQNGVRPFVELSFMPSKLAASQTPHAFWYKPLPNPPKDYAKWGALVGAFAKHLIERYGLAEVSQWLFEVWNEPNIDFWTGVPKEETYYRLYGAAAEALKKASPRLRVGGPATAQAAWVGRFIEYCVQNRVPFDFVSTHVYGNDSARDVFGTAENISRKDMVYRAVKKAREEIAGSARPKAPLYFTEFNASYMNEVNVTDSPFMGPWLANTIRLCDGLVEIMSYWSLSDVFEEQGVVKTPFYGGYGLIAAGNIPKAALNDFRLLHLLGETRIENASGDALVTRRADGALAVAVWNYAAPEEAGSEREFRLVFKNAGTRNVARIRVVDAGHGNALAAWESMGRPAFPTREQQEKLRKAGEFPEPVEESLGHDGVLRLRLEPKALAVIEVLEKVR